MRPRQLDTYIGRPIESIEGNEVKLEGGITVISEEPLDAVWEPGLLYGNLVISEESAQMVVGVIRHKENGKPVFTSEQRIPLTHGKYTIKDARDNKEWNPADIEDHPILVPDPERFQDGPEPDWQAQRQALIDELPLEHDPKLFIYETERPLLLPIEDDPIYVPTKEVEDAES